MNTFTERQLRINSQIQEIMDEYTASGRECGLQLAVYDHGTLLCDLASGFTDGTKSKKVTSNTLFPVFSAGKCVMTTLMLILYQENVFGLDDPVCRYWKEFGKNGKQKITIRHVLHHSSGLHDPPPRLKFADYYRWDVFCSALADVTPETEPGEKKAYHGYTYGALCGKIAEEATGKPLLTLLQEKIFEPLNIRDMYFSLPEERYGDLASILDPEDNESFLSHNQPYVLSGLNPSTNCCTNARSLARLYASVLPPGTDGKVLLEEKTVREAVSFGYDPENDFPTDRKKRFRFGLGFVRFGDISSPFRLFGQTGAAGSEGIADRESGLTMAFLKNRNIPGKPISEARNRIARVLGLPEMTR